MLLFPDPLLPRITISTLSCLPVTRATLQAHLAARG